jgi:peptidylprolyl isomerase
MTKYMIPLLLAAVALAAGCGGSEEAVVAQEGDTVRVEYTGTLEDGTEFDSSFGREPLEFTVGGGSMIRGFDRAVLGMAPGESKRVVIPAADAYGPPDPNLIIDVSRSQLPPGLDPQVGQQLAMTQPDGRQVPVTVVAANETTVTIDANHSLAGKDLTFDILLLEILPPPAGTDAPE